MKLWLLQPIDAKSGPWNPWYNRCFGHVVRAKTATRAREIAAIESGEEGGKPWLDYTLSTCVELTRAGDAGVVIQSVRTAG